MDFEQDLDLGIVAACLQAGRLGVKQLNDAGVMDEMIAGVDARRAYAFLRTHVREHGVAPSPDLFKVRMGFSLPVVQDPLSVFIELVKERHMWNMQVSFMQEFGELVNQRKPMEAHERYEQFQRDLRKSRANPMVISSIWSAAEDVIEAYEAAKAGKIGVPSPWPAMNEMIRGFNPGDFVVFAARLGTGKCVSAESRVTCADSGRLMSMRELVEQRLPTLTHHRSKGIVGCTPSHWIKTGTKKCLRIRTRLGNEVVVPPNDPLLTAEGWKRADRLQVGERIVQVAKLPEPRCPVALGESTVNLLAVLLSKGSLSGNHVGFSTGDDDFLRMVNRAADEIGFSVVYRSRYDCDLVIGPGEKVSAKKWLESLCVPLVKAVDRSIPDVVFMLPNDELRVFLRTFWWGDGCADGTLVLGSERLIDDIKHLFLRFGVVMRKEYKPVRYRGGIRDSWRLRPDSWTRDAFNEVMADLPGEKGKFIQRDKRKRNTNVDVIPVTDEMVSAIQGAACDYRRRGADRRGLFSDSAKRLGWKKPRGAGMRSFVSTNGKSTVARRRIAALIETAEGRLESLEWMIHEDIVWSVITAIDDDGEQEVYDLSVPETECYVADGVVVHNTWLLLMLAEHAWKMGYHVLFISPEMAKFRLAMRAFSLNLGMAYTNVLRGQLGDIQEPIFYKNAMALKHEDGFDYLGSNFKCTPENIEDAVAVTRPEIVFVDGLYLVKGQGRNRTETMANVADELKGMAGAYGIPFVVSTQFNRDVKRNDPSTVDVGSIGISDVIGWSADVGWAVVQTDDMRTNKEMMLRPLKIREGGDLKDIWLDWDFSKMLFTQQEAGRDDGFTDDEFNAYADRATQDTNAILDTQQSAEPPTNDGITF